MNGDNVINAGDGLYVLYSPNFLLHEKIASFDLDWTLVRPGRGNFPKTYTDVYWLPNRRETLKYLSNESYSIIIFTNQKVGKKNKLNDIIERMLFVLAIFEEVKIEVIILVATLDNDYRKPNIGMWKYLTEIYRTSEFLYDINKSFYVGDAAGRLDDFSDSDREFARNIPLQFYNEIEYFPITYPEFIINDFIPNRTLIVFVGSPGSGKTTFATRYLSPYRFVHINQDMLKTRSNVLKTLQSNLELGNNIVIDSTNPRQETRQEYYNMAENYDYNIMVFWFVRNGESRNKLRQNPVPAIALRTYYYKLVDPADYNTPGNVYEIYL